MTSDIKNASVLAMCKTAILSIFEDFAHCLNVLKKMWIQSFEIIMEWYDYPKFERRRDVFLQ